MLPYQNKYHENTAEIAYIVNERQRAAEDFDTWYEEQKENSQRLEELKSENIKLLNENLFPVLDGLYGESEVTIKSLEEFADVLMDWRTNLDCGVYVVIHDALLSLYRYRKDRDGIIKELYKLGMGLYYLRRAVEGVPGPGSRSIAFENELVFTEAGSYIRFFDVIEDEETRGYIVRALANVSLCTNDHKRKIAQSMRALEIIRDEHFRELAPGIPWDVFLKKTHQQMSANRTELSGADLSKEELAAVLDSCYEVFKPEEGAVNPSVRWLWPYYEMEYNCGYVDINMTMDRIERLSGSVPYDHYDVSGLYANVQLPIYYGRLLKKDVSQRHDPHRITFYESAVKKMLRALFTCPEDYMDDYFFYLIDLVVSDYYEVEGATAYYEIIPRLLKRFSGKLYIRSVRIGTVVRELAQALIDDDEGFFDDIPFIAEISEPEKKRKTILEFAEDCGLYQDFGLLKMNLSRTISTRNLFENEFQMYQLHPISGYEDLRDRRSTERFADVAHGHHRWYDGTGGYPESYIRNESPMRQMTDVCAVATEMVMNYDGDIHKSTEEILKVEGTRFSPLVTACLTDRDLLGRLDEILSDDSKKFYHEIYQELNV